MNRRRFLKSAAATSAALGLGEWDALLPLSPANADEAKVTPDLVRFGPDIEPIVRLIEETTREKCPAMMIELLKKELPYRHFLGALYLANLRSGLVEHTLAVLHSANQLTLDAPIRERLLPTFWALDTFKFFQERGDITPSLKPLTGKLPSADRAEQEFLAAKNAFNNERAERAIVVLARTNGIHRVIEHLWTYGARDWNFIGHNAIWVANTWRTLQTVGSQHAETMLRVVVRSMDQNHDLPLQPYAGNVARVDKALGALPADWASSGYNPHFTQELLALWRDATSVPRSESPRKGEFPGVSDSRMTAHAVKKREEACELAVTQLVQGKVTAGAVWDAAHLAAGELFLCGDSYAVAYRLKADGEVGSDIFQYRGPVLSDALHANTVTNALHYAFQVSTEPSHRLLLLLQAVGWLFHFRENLADKFGLSAPRDLTRLTEADIPPTLGAASERILAARHAHSQEAVAMAYTFARRYPDSRALFRAGGRVLPMKAGQDTHHLKFPVAAFENCEWVSREWRPNMVGAASLALLGSEQPDTALMTQVREAVHTL